jgi:hypothetical protein
MSVRQYHQWLEDESFSGEDLEKVRSFLAGILQHKGIDEHLAKPPAGPGSAETEQEAPFDLVAVMLPDFTGNPDKEPPVFDVTSQSGGLISLIIPAAQKPLMVHLKPGARVNGASFFTPEALFSEDCVVSSRFRIDEGRRKGDFSVTLRLLGV